MDALRILKAPLEVEGPWPEGLALAARAHLRLGELAQAKARVAAGLRAAPEHLALLQVSAEVALAEGATSDAEAALRKAAAVAPNDVGAVVGLASFLSDRGRPAEALEALSPLSGRPDPPHAVIAAEASALKACGRLEEALELHRRAAERFAGSPVSHHNLAATLGDLMRHSEAEASARRAFKVGGGAPETYLVLGRALKGQNRLDEAEAALEEAVARNPYYVEAQRDLAELVWMRTEDLNAAGRRIEPALAAAPGASALVEVKTTLLRYAGDVPGALAAAEAGLRAAPESAALHMAASTCLSLLGRRQEALAHARTAVALGPGAPGPLAMLCEACLAAGEAELARDVAEKLLLLDPYNQSALAYRATAHRLLSDPRYGDLYAYDNLVWSGFLDTPKGWDSLESYLADLAPALKREHPFKTHPLGQSVRHGSQASYIQASEDPALRAFPEAIDGPIRRRLEALGTGEDPVRSRALGGYALSGIWSVRLRPGGFHADHIHPLGWLSSACYVEVPDPRLEDAPRAGWIQFGRPGITTSPELGPERFIEPKPGLLVLFPSYMWHGTVPFRGPTHRLTIAFDLVPAAAHPPRVTA